MPPDEEATVGASIPLGNLERTAFTLANTSASAPAGSVFSFILTVIVDAFGALLDDI